VGTIELEYSPTVPDLLSRAVRLFGDREYVVTDKERATFAEVDVAARHLALKLVAAGVGKGTRIGACFSYGREWIVAWLAVNRIGAIYLPFSTAYKPAELRHAVRHGDVHILLVPSTLLGKDRLDFHEEAFPRLRSQSTRQLSLTVAPYLRAVWVTGDASMPAWATPLAMSAGATDELASASAELLVQIESEVRPSDAAISIYTSGTTAEPKGVIHTHGALVRKAHSLVSVMEWGKEERVFCGMPFFWVGGLVMAVVPALDHGVTLLCLDRPEAERSLDLMEKEQATQLTGWPGVTGPIMRHPSISQRSIPALARGVFAPAGSARTTNRQGGLGMTETLGPHTSTHLLETLSQGEHASCVGVPIESIEHKIVDPETGIEQPEGSSGTLLVRSYCLTIGLHKREREEVFTLDGWYDTGDRCYFKDGVLFFEGRLKEMIKTSGNNVAPPEVESVLVSAPDVAEAYVLGVPDSARGEAVAAAVVPAAGATLEPDRLRERVRKELSNYKVPRTILVLSKDDVPTLATGKVDRLAVKALLVAHAVER